jgi:hypothetical protein
MSGGAGRGATFRSGKFNLGVALLKGFLTCGFA